MKLKTNKTFVAKKENLDLKKWYLIDASNQVLGRLATKIANLLRGKNKPIFTPNVDTGDFVIVINASKVLITGKKLKSKKKFSYSGYPGGEKLEVLEKLLKEKPEEVIRKAVKGMLPHNKLSNKLINKLKVYRTEIHPHQAQKPVKVG